MLKKDQPLRMPVDFDNAMFLGITVIVWQDGEIIGYGKQIEIRLKSKGNIF